MYTSGEQEAVNGTDVRLKCTFESKEAIKPSILTVSWTFRPLGPGHDESVRERGARGAVCLHLADTKLKQVMVHRYIYSVESQQHFVAMWRDELHMSQRIISKS